MTSPAHQRSDVVVVGVGAATPIGGTAAASAAAVRGGIGGFGDHPYMIDARGEPFVVAMAPYLEPDMGVEARILELASAAAHDALGTLQAVAEPTEMTAIVGVPEARPGLRSDLASRVADSLRRRSGR